MKKAILCACVTLVAIWVAWAVFIKPGNFSLNPMASFKFYVGEEATQEWGPDILFLETAGRTCVTGRQACAIESAQLRNPSSRIRLFTTAAMNASCDFYDVVSRLANFETHVLNLSAVFQGTPLESWYYESGWNTSEYRVVHLSDSLRYLLLWKNGGIYLDLDFIIVDSLNDTRNGAVYQAPDDPANGMLFFDRGHPFLLEVLNSIKDHYNRNAFSCIGPLLLKSIYKKLCETSKCLGVTMYPIKFAYPVPWQNWKEYFDPKLTSTILERSKEGRAVHFWNFLSSKRVVRTGDGSAYDMLANQNCPKTYTLMTEKGVF